MADIKRVFVAVHGIGEQTNNQTIQAVAAQFCRHQQANVAIPLGSFYSDPQAPFKAFPLTHPPYPKDLAGFNLAEVYWAGIPRQSVADGHILEEARKWAQTIIVRYSAYRERQHRALSKRDYNTLGMVLPELIQTVAVLERLVFLAERAGIFRFDLQKLLVNSVGDIQIVTEFAAFRAEILARFNEVMSAVYDPMATDAEQEIYIIAHSEGTVIAFLGLLTAMSQPPSFRATSQQSSTPAQPPDGTWVKRVRGLMTLGSPIDKHLMLWPQLWQDFETASSPRNLPAAPIKWRNYYDYGDPIGYELDEARHWLERYHWDTAFEFNAATHDIGFSRYPLPGKAHSDYWQDDEIFGHFLKTVVGLPGNRRKGGTRKDSWDRLPAKLISYVVPYAIAVTLLFAAVFFLYKGVAASLPPQSDTRFWSEFARGSTLRGNTLRVVNAEALKVAANLSGITLLLLGLTAATRIPRLTSSSLLRWFAVGVFSAIMLLTVLVFRFVFTESFRAILSAPFERLSLPPLPGLLGLMLILSVAIFLLSSVFPRWGPRVLVLLGSLPVLGIAAFLLWTRSEKIALWPTLLGGAGFLYLWWLAALIFDLAFVWHLYIRHSREADRKTESSVQYLMGGQLPEG
jgi:hypothetical protein